MVACSCTCTVCWRSLASFSWARSRVARNNNCFTSAIHRHWVSGISRGSHHFSRSIMRHYTCVGHSLAHVHHGIHNRSWDVHALRHHHSSSILHHGTHFGATCISRSHCHSRTNCSTERIASGFKHFWWTTHVTHHWAHDVTHRFKCSANITAFANCISKSLLPSAHRLTKSLRISLHDFHKALRHRRHWHWKHCHIKSSYTT